MRRLAFAIVALMLPSAVLGAAADARWPPRKNVAMRVTFPIYDADGDLITGATGLDSESSCDAGTQADVTSEATEIATSTGTYYLDLTAGEMNCDTVSIVVKSTSAGSKDTVLVLYPNEVTDIRVNIEAISDDTTAPANAESFFDGTGYAGTGNTIPTVTTATTCTTASTCTAIGADGITAASIAASAITSSEAPNLDAAVSTRATPAQVNTEVLDVLKTDTSTLPGSGAPTATPTIEEMIEYLYKAWRNKKEQTASQFSLYDDTGVTVEQKATVSDDGTTTTVEEIVSGP